MTIDGNPFQEPTVQVVNRSLPCSKLKHDNCTDFLCMCDCHTYQIYDANEERWFYAPQRSE